MKRPDPFVLLAVGSTMSLAFYRMGLCPMPPLLQRPTGSGFPRSQNARLPRRPRSGKKGPFRVS